MPDQQDILSIGFDYKKAQADADKVIAQMDRIIQAGEKFTSSFAGLDVSGGFAASKKGAEQLNKTLQETTKSIIDYSKGVENAAKQMAADAKAKEQYRQEQQKFNRELKATVEIENTEAGSIARARAELKGLNLLRNNTNVTTKEGREELIRLNAEIDRNNKFIKENADQYLKQKINIGNYPDTLKNIGSGIRNIADNLLATIGVTAGLSGLFSFFKSSVDEANQAEQATTRFKNALSNIGRQDVYERLSKKADEFANKFRNLDNDNITEVFQQLITYGKLTEKQITDLTPVIINFAAKSGISLNESASTIIKALEGNARALKDYGISIKDGKDVTERFGIVMTDLKDKVDGAAQAFGETFSGQVAIAQQDMANLKEEIGKELTPVLSKFYQSVYFAISGIKAIASTVKDAFVNAFGAIALGAGVIKDFVTFDFSNISKRIEKVKGERDAVENSIKSQKELAEARKIADSVAADAATKPLKVQQEILKGNIALKEASFKNYNDLVGQGKKLTAEGHAAALQLYTDSQTVLALQKVIASTQDKSILGTGDPDAGLKTKKVKAIKDISDAVADLRKELSKIQNNVDIGQLTIKEADIDRVKAYQKAFDQIFERGGNAKTPIVQQLAVELNPITKRILTEQVKDLNNHLKADKLEIPPPDTRKAIEIGRTYREGEAQFTEEMLQRELTLQQTASLKEQAILEEKFNSGKISREEYERDLLSIQEKYSKQAVQSQIKAVQAEIDLLDVGTKEREDAEKRLAELTLNYNKIISDDRKKKNEEIVRDIQKIQEVFNQLADLGAGLVNISTTRQKNDLQDLEDTRQKNYQQEIDRINNSTLSEQDKADRVKVLEAQRQAQKEEYDRKNREIEQKKARFDKQIAIMNIILNTAVSIAKVLGDPFQVILAAALGAAELAVAIATPIPKYAKGVKNKSNSGIGVAGEAGAEIVHLPGQKPFIVDQETVMYMPRGTDVTPISKDGINDIMYRTMARQTAMGATGKSDKSEILLMELIKETRKNNKNPQKVGLYLINKNSWEIEKKKYYS